MRVINWNVVVKTCFLLSAVMMVSLAVAAPAPTGRPTTFEAPVPIGPGLSVKGVVIQSSPATEVTGQERPLAPSLTGIIEGINFDENWTNAGRYYIPPDPIGAAGPSHLVSVVNVSIEWHTKAGVLQNSQSLYSFFNLTGPNAPFDPKVIYDQYADRFVVVALYVEDYGVNHQNNVSDILVAVSEDSNPNGTWHKLTIDAKETINSVDHWADYPGFAVDSQAVYITNNMYSFTARDYGGARLWIIDKGVSGGFYSGGTAVWARYDPYAATGFAITTQPAHMFGTVQQGVGTFLVSYSGLSNGSSEFLQFVRVDSPLASPTFMQQFLDIGDIEDVSTDMPDAPQSGTTTKVETNDRRALHAVWRNNTLWTTAQIVPPSDGADGDQATAHWWKIDTTNLGALALLDQGDVGAEDLGTSTHTFFPSIAVDRNGNMAMGFAASNSNIYPGAYYTGRKSTDPAGTVQSTSTLAAGQDWYIRQFGGTRNRWGDYSGISVDPNNDTTFWIFNEYALTRGTILGSYPTEDGRWGTRWGRFSISGSPTPVGPFLLLLGTP